MCLEHTRYPFQPTLSLLILGSAKNVENCYYLHCKITIRWKFFSLPKYAMLLLCFQMVTLFVSCLTYSHRSALAWFISCTAHSSMSQFTNPTQVDLPTQKGEILRSLSLMTLITLHNFVYLYICLVATMSCLHVASLCFVSYWFLNNNNHTVQ